MKNRIINYLSDDSKVKVSEMRWSNIVVPELDKLKKKIKKLEKKIGK